MIGASSMLLSLLIALPIGLLIGAVILRVSVSLYNKMAGAGTQVVQANLADYSPNVAGGAENENPFAALTTYGSPPSSQTVGVAEPGFGRACGIVFVTWLGNLSVSVIVIFLVRLAPNTAVLLSVLFLLINFLISAAILKGMLPTKRFGVACLIQLLQFVIALIVVVVLAVIGLVVWFAARR